MSLRACRLGCGMDGGINLGKAEGRRPVRCRRQRLQRWSGLLPSQEHKDASPLDLLRIPPKVGVLGRGVCVDKLSMAELLNNRAAAEAVIASLPPLISPVKKASRVEVRASHQKGSQGALL